MSISYAQPDTLFEKIEKQIDKKRSRTFLSIDKALYQTGETIWFSGLVFDNKDTSELHTLHVLLVNDMLQSVVSDQRFVMEAGSSYGQVIIPDSLQTGAYSIIAYTNQFAANPQSHDYYRQSIEIAGTTPAFKVAFADAGLSSGDSIFVKARITDTETETLVSNATFYYAIYSFGKEVKEGKIKIGITGEVVFSMPIEIALWIPEIRLVISGDKDSRKSKNHATKNKTAYYKLPLQWVSAYNLLQLHSEGGKLIDNQPAKLYFRLTNTLGEGVSKKLVLKEDGQPIGIFEPDIYGSGIIDFIPKMGLSYVLEFQERERLILQQFPSIMKTGYAINIVQNNAPNDSLKLRITAPAGARPFTVSFRNNTNNLMGQFTIKLNGSQGYFNLSSKEWKKGIGTITIHDHDKLQQAHRRFFLQPVPGVITTASVDSLQYLLGSEITLQVDVNDKQGEPLPAVFSVAVVLKRYITDQYRDIETYYYAGSGRQGENNIPFNKLKQSNLLDYLLVKETNEYSQGRNQNKWMNHYSPGLWDGKVSDKKGKAINAPVTLSINSSRPVNFKTNVDGSFKIPVNLLRVRQGEKLIVRVKEEKPGKFSLWLDSSTQQLNRLLALEYLRLPEDFNSELQGGRMGKEWQLLKVHQLETIVVRSQIRKPVSLYGNLKKEETVVYRCIYGAVNCPNHPNFAESVQPSKYYSNPAREGTYSYIGSVVPTFYKEAPRSFKGKRDAEASVGFDSQHLSSTIYWNPEVRMDKNGKATLTFYANNVKGPFECIVQGVTAKGVVTGRTEFEVK